MKLYVGCNEFQMWRRREADVSGGGAMQMQEEVARDRCQWWRSEADVSGGGARQMLVVAARDRCQWRRRPGHISISCLVTLKLMTDDASLRHEFPVSTGRRQI